MKFRTTASGAILLLSIAVLLTSCSSSNSSLSTSGGTGYLWLTAQGNTTVQAYTIATSDGALSLNSSAIPTGTAPIAILTTPKGDAAFVLDSESGPSGGPGISAYTINSDGTLKASGSIVPVMTKGGAPCSNPMGLAIAPAGNFLFTACEGSFDLSQPGSISVFAVSGATLTQVAGSPFSAEATGAIAGTGPVAVAVSASGNYLYVANEFANTVSSFQISSAGVLTPLNAYSVGTSPSALFVSIAQGTTVPAGQYLYVANSGSSNVSAFSICDAANASGCTAPNGFLAPIAGSPFPAQPGPVAIAMDPTAAFLYVADGQGNQISQYSWSAVSGVLTPLTPAFISAGGSPVSLAIRSGILATATAAGTDYMYAANINASSVSVYTLNTTTGQLNVLGSPFTTPSQPSALTAR